jgi:ATP/ADP translocase
MGFTSRVLRVDPSERRTTALVASLMFMSLAGAAIGESGINALFFDRIGTGALPLMYLAQAGSTLVAMFALTATLERVSHRSVYVWSPVLLAAVVLAERGVVLTGARWIYPVMWVTVAFATLAQAIGLWGTAGAVVDARQAKRLFPIFGAGGILGSVVGGLLTRPLAAALGAENLLLVWAGGLLVASALCRLSLGREGAAHPAGPRRHGSVLDDLRSGFAYVRHSRLLTAMAGAAVLFSVLFYSLFLPFATVATERFSDAAELAGFFGLVWATITGAAFLVSMLLTNRLFSRFGVAVMVLVLPLLYLGSFGILLAGTGFATIVALRVMTGVWLQGVASPGWIRPARS